jgi:hypothetical protein
VRRDEGETRVKAIFIDVYAGWYLRLHLKVKSRGGDSRSLMRQSLLLITSDAPTARL